MRALHFDILVHVRQYQGEPLPVRAAIALAQRVVVHACTVCMSRRFHRPRSPRRKPSRYSCRNRIVASTKLSRRRPGGTGCSIPPVRAATGGCAVRTRSTRSFTPSRWNDLIVIERPQLKPEAPLGWGPRVAYRVRAPPRRSWSKPEGAQIEQRSARASCDTVERQPAGDPRECTAHCRYSRAPTRSS